MKTAIRIIALFLVIAAAGAGGYYILKGAKLPTFSDVEEIVPFQIGGGGTPTDPSEIISGEIPEGSVINSESGNVLEKVSHGAVFAYSAISDSEIYYFAQDGRVFHVKSDGDELVSERTLVSLNGVWITNDRKRALVSFGDPHRPEWGIFDFLDAAWRPLPTSIVYAAWSGDNDTLIAIEETNNSRNLVSISLLKNAPVSTLLLKNFGMDGVTFISPNKGKVVIVEKASSLYRGSAWELDTKTLSVKALFLEEAGLLIKALPSGQGFLKFSSPNKLSLLSVVGEVKKDFVIKTIPEKCGGSGEKLYCFVPTNILEHVLLPDDYFKNKVSFVDALYSVNPTSGQDEVIFQSGIEGMPQIDGEKPSLLGERLYFMNRHDKRIYRINLTLLGGGSAEVE